MPELPEVETIAQELNRKLIGSTITNVFVGQKKLRKPYPKNIKESLISASVERVGRHGKSLLLKTNKGKTLLFHLGMTGKMDLHAGDAFSVDSIRQRDKHEHFALKLLLSNKDSGELSFIDPRRFGMIELITSGTPLKGMDPINGSGFDLEDFIKALSRTSAPIKSALLRQDIVTGIGNIYASEILHKAHIHPLEPASNLSREEVIKLHQAIIDILQFAVEKGGSSIRDYVHSDGSRGSFQDHHQVYDKEGKNCRFCSKAGEKGAVIQREVLSGRSTYFCPVCQPKKKKRRKKAKT